MCRDDYLVAALLCAAVLAALYMVAGTLPSA